MTDQQDSRWFMGLLTVALLVLNAVGGSAEAPTSSDTFGTPARSFRPDCELIMNGKDMEPASHEGKRGYWVAKSDSAITVNGVIFISKSTLWNSPTTTASAKSQHAAAVIEAAANIVWDSREKHGGSIVLNDEQHAIGDRFTLRIAEHDAFVEVSLSNDMMLIMLEGAPPALYPMHRSQPSPPLEELVERQLDSRYHELARALRPGRLILKGRGYEYSYPLADSARVRQALALAAETAEVEYRLSNGVVFYKPVSFDGLHWVSDVIRDVVADRGER